MTAERDLDAFGARVAAAQRQMLVHHDRKAVRVRLEHTLRQSRSRGWMAIAAAAALCTVVAIAILGFRGKRTREQGFLVSGAAGVEPSGWIAVPAGSQANMSFRDGSSVALSGGTRARVDMSRSDHARLVVSEGAVLVSIRQSGVVSWSFQVGPFELIDMGTKFSATWSSSKARFELRVQEGAVHVAGPGIPVGKTFLAGEGFEIGSPAPVADAGVLDRATDLELEIPSERPDAWSPATPVAVASSDASAGAEGGQDSGSVQAIEDWKALARNRRHAEAVAAVRSSGVESALAGANEDELMMLGDGARFAGDTGLASRAYQTLRGRYPGSPRASAAAFLMGRMSADQMGSPQAAATWFEAYLRENPNGPFALEAAGRLIEVRVRMGDRPAAAAAARAYLARYPGGPHAPLAKSVIEPARGAEPAP